MRKNYLVWVFLCFENISAYKPNRDSDEEALVETFHLPSCILNESANSVKVKLSTIFCFIFHRFKKSVLWI